MQTYVAKFGGSSLADAEQFKKVAEIIKAKPARRYVVASAPGKRSSDDIKVTDLLYACYNAAVAGEDFMPVLDQIKERFDEIIRDCGISFDLDTELAVIAAHLYEGPEKDYMASRGEYLNSRILAAYLDFDFLDPAECVLFKEDGHLDAETTNDNLSRALRNRPYTVIPGFYGALADGTIHTFSRGGSDVTGSLVARAVHADLYENWTDVSGMMSADPRIVDQPRIIEAITYRELRELSYMGASVMHEAAVFPVRKAGIMMNIRNTNRPEDAGTLIASELPRVPRKHKVTGIAGMKGFTSILVEDSSMNDQVGYGMKLLGIFARHNVPFEHLPTGIDTMSVVVRTALFDPFRNQIMDEIRDEIGPEMLFVEDHLAMIAVVGQGMAYSKGTAARIMKALSDARINIRMIDQGSSEINIIICVDEEDYENAIRSIYNEIEFTL